MSMDCDFEPYVVLVYSSRIRVRRSMALGGWVMFSVT